MKKPALFGRTLLGLALLIGGPAHAETSPPGEAPSSATKDLSALDRKSVV